MLILMLDLNQGLKKFRISQDYTEMVSESVIVQANADNEYISLHICIFQYLYKTFI